MQTLQGDILQSLMVGSGDSLQRLLMFLVMTPVVKYSKELSPSQSMSVEGRAHDQTRPNGQGDPQGKKGKLKSSSLDLFCSLSHSRSREETLLFGSFNFQHFLHPLLHHLPSPAITPILAFLCSWGCVHFLDCDQLEFGLPGPQLHGNTEASATEGRRHQTICFWQPTQPTGL